LVEKSLGQRAVVIGGSIAGLLSARVLADYFEQVDVLERDPLPAEPTHRDGSPQDRHVHAFLKGGENIINEWFPGFGSDLENGGSISIDMGKDLKYYGNGHWRPRQDSGFRIHAQSRPFLEWTLRKRVAELPNVTIHEECRVGEVLFDNQNTRVCGVEYRQADSNPPLKSLEAGFVVDASGRGSFAPNWLKSAGYEPARSELVKINLGYTSGFYQPPDNLPKDWLGLASNTSGPDEPLGGGIYPVEGGRWLVTMVGYFGDHPPTDHEGFEAHAKRLPQPDIYNALQDATPISPIKIYPFVGGVRRFYNELERLPDQFVVIGDAHAALNPIFGQGMTKAALEAKTLEDCLKMRAATEQGQLSGLQFDFFKRTAEIIEGPWVATNFEDFKYAKTSGKRPFGFKFKFWYQKKFLSLLETDPELYAKVFRVSNFLESPEGLKSPSIILRTLLHRPS